ncbi:MAG TPA: Fe2+-dependent dioxygenase [Candidatus Binatia bacterium]|nr:Fe2+-dependent dioxygenase [Candidatus Binatia bacterium]
MYLHIPSLIKPKQLLLLTRNLEQAKFADGRHTAGSIASSLKRNKELSPGPIRDSLGSRVLAALMADDTFKSYALPRHISKPEFVIYDRSMHYDKHVDAAIFNMSSAQQIRTDLAVTVLLNSSEDYDGGELLLYEDSKKEALKFAAGDAVVYSCTRIHEVTRVTRGRRIVAVAWVQSYVRDEAKRRLLHCLNEVAESGVIRGEREKLTELSSIYHNLMRMWASSD